MNARFLTNTTKKHQNFIDKIKSNNKKVIAQYLALYTENSHLKKCLITLTPYDGKLSTVLKIRREFFKLLNRYKRNKNNGDLSIKYFSNIEFTKTSQPHLHIQLFYSNLNPIKKAYEAVLCKNYKNDQSNSLCLAKDNSKNFNYVIKDYINFDLQLEQFKHHFRNVNFTTSSQKSISNSIVKYIYKNYKFKTKNRYKEILSAILNETIIISRDKKDSLYIKSHITKNSTNSKSIKLILKEKVGVHYIYLFEEVDIKVKRKCKNKDKTKNEYKNSSKSKYKRKSNCRFGYRIKIKRVKKTKKSKVWAFKIKG